MVARVPLLAALLLAALACDSTPPPFSVFGAASLRDVLRDAAEAFERERELEVAISCAGSNVLARQIRAEPEAADVFVSADALWMDDLEDAGLILGSSRTTLATNALVIVARRDSTLAIDGAAALPTSSFRALAVADPTAVPAGRYARAALERVPARSGTVWDAVADRVVSAADVRAALAIVESDPEIAGIVYATDAATSRSVKILARLETAGPDDIRYVGAATARSRHPEAARDFLRFLASDRGRALFRARGFGAPAEEGS